ncbi:hypothetical protein ACWDYJ_16220 [Streptomyces sp. NPDC003042]
MTLALGSPLVAAAAVFLAVPAVFFATTFRAPVFCAAGAAPSTAAALAVTLLVVLFPAAFAVPAVFFAGAARFAAGAVFLAGASVAVAFFAVVVFAGVAFFAGVRAVSAGVFFAGVFFAAAFLAGAARSAAGGEPFTASTSRVAVFFATMAAAPFHIL